MSSTFIPGPVATKPALSPPSDPAKGAAIIFLHGLGDDSGPWENVADQFQRAHKLDHTTWILPTAPDDKMQEMNAWYTPSPLSPWASQRPELDDPEDEEGMMKSVQYAESLIDDVIAKGIPAHRIVLGGFSQGHAIALLTGLTSKKYAGKLAGLVCLSGYLPIPDRIMPFRKENGLPEVVGGFVKVFLVRGKTDMLVPKRYLRLQIEKFMDLGIPGEVVEVHEYEGLGHAVRSDLLMDLLKWLERIIPELE
ncbi:hypothetical protein BLS_000502 [Venturia inaequalis]|uniref:Acyl-protein thioesterase 1 n=1 Tax=Venturia inaequalis TaxID=5025 RepID=A0A8H3U317_VENIN|nr:hypothetical protein BLS_000502 [Venturia inaequalis]KAE9989464.1 hypothetical protein EG327_002656 [Venturia inaequalis]RDI87041.1 Glutamine-dependent NAD(+) synthetase [Venturia inaequalis]